MKESHRDRQRPAPQRTARRHAGPSAVDSGYLFVAALPRRCSSRMFDPAAGLRRLPQPVPRAARRRLPSSPAWTTTPARSATTRLIAGVVRVALFFARPGADHARPSRCSPRWPSTAGCCASPKVFRLGIFVPYAVPGVVATLMWGYLYGPDFGPFAQLADAIGIGAPGLPRRRPRCSARSRNIVTWEFTGYNMIILYAALRADPAPSCTRPPPSTAPAPGASRWNIKIPALRPALLLCLIFSVIGSFQLFNEPQLLQRLAPNVIDSAYTPEPVRLQPRVHRPGGQLRRRGLVPARAW